ncbi:MAG TPA: DUF2243 domain-containing protein, partial [Rubrivivax sp.]|nr:DUF2243 domain-containing protein [Rubrivivax sp.]
MPVRHACCCIVAMNSSAPAGSSDHRRLLQAAWMLGIAFSGFFDGILLHQVLQWHHLLSGLDGEGWNDI